MPRGRCLPLRPYLLVATVWLAGCRACDEGVREVPREAAGPTMPTGMLSPLPAEPRTPPEPTLGLARGKRDGEWVELQIARADDHVERTREGRWRPDSLFLSVDTMTLLHEAFARALPGFDLFLPRRFDDLALGRLRTELEAMKRQVIATSTAQAARERWGQVSAVVAQLPDDAAWADARTTLLGTLDELQTLAKALESKGEVLWVLAG